MTLKTAIDRGSFAPYSGPGPWPEDGVPLPDDGATYRPKVREGTGPDVFALVQSDLAVRARVGMAEYGVPLRAHNGRDALWDAYEEALDLAVYLRQALAEREVLASERGETT